MKYIIAILVFVFLIVGLVYAQTTKIPNPMRLRVMTYNVENLFDTINDKQTLDDEFTPEGSYGWNGQRYRKKLHQLESVINRVGESSWPLFVGLVEVENADVLTDLLEMTSLGNHHYSYRISHGSDPRGVNVALLYRDNLFTPTKTSEYVVSFPKDTLKHTRNLLHIEGTIGSVYLHVFVCHLPSKRGGVSQSQYYRDCVLAELQRRCDSIGRVSTSSPYILIMGDFNDRPKEIPTREIQLQNPSPSNYPGTYCYRGVWTQIDQILLSAPFFSDSSNLRYIDQSVAVYAPEELRRRNSRTARRTFGGQFYMGGLSDHFPLYLDLYLSLHGERI